jgi:hypothetical protein
MIILIILIKLMIITRNFDYSTQQDFYLNEINDEHYLLSCVNQKTYIVKSMNYNKCKYSLL